MRDEGKEFPGSRVRRSAPWRLLPAGEQRYRFTEVRDRPPGIGAEDSDGEKPAAGGDAGRDQQRQETVGGILPPRDDDDEGEDAEEEEPDPHEDEDRPVRPQQETDLGSAAVRPEAPRDLREKTASIAGKTRDDEALAGHAAGEGRPGVGAVGDMFAQECGEGLRRPRTVQCHREPRDQAHGAIVPERAPSFRWREASPVMYYSRVNTLGTALAGLCRDRLLVEKWLLAPTRRIGQQWLEQAVRAGTPALNVRVETLRSMAVNLAAPALAAAGVRIVPRRASLLLMDRLLAALRSRRLRYLRHAVPGLGLAATALASLESLRLAGVTALRLRRGIFEGDAKGGDLKVILQGYLDLLRRENLIDYAAVLAAAAERLRTDPAALGGDTVVLVPADLELCGLEQRLLGALPTERRVDLPVDGPGLPENLGFAHAVGEVNEVRAVLRSCLSRGVRLDEIELLHTNPAAYVPLVYETFATLARSDAAPGDEPPVTFAEGLPCSYSRPGRALAAWVGWTGEDFPQAALVAMVREGLLAVEEDEEERIGFARLAALLRGVGIGFGRERYLTKIDERIKTLENGRTGDPDQGEDEEVLKARREQIERDLAAFGVLRRLCARLIEIAPAAAVSDLDLVVASRRFLETSARAVSRLDRFAAEKLCQEMEAMVDWLTRDRGGPAAEIRAWLAALPRETKVLGSGPRPGCLHVDRLTGGGHSGRPQTFIVGLDDGRFPGAGLQDPLLLDRERIRLSPELPTAADRLGESVRNFARLLGRLRGTVTLSWPSRHLTEDRDLFPSPVLLDAFRSREGDSTADQAELRRRLGPPASFAPATPAEGLDLSEWWLWRLTGAEEVENTAELLARHTPNLERGREAAAARAGAAFTAWDGFVPRAGALLDPTAATGKVLSAGGLETAGACPLRFFFKYALEIAPPEELVIEETRWLDPLRRGSLLHELFEDFMRELIAAGRLPSFERDRPRLIALFEAKIAAALDDCPPPSTAVFQREREEFTTIAETFLRDEEDFCREARSTPAFLEASLGLPPGKHGTAIDTLEPVFVPLPGGGGIRTRGRVDRIDRIGEAPGTWAIWDYKTGGTYGYERADPFVEGRKIQPYLYVRMVEQRLRGEIGPAETVRSFGYFFPGLKAMGNRYLWAAERLDGGGAILELLCRGIAAGAFVATTDPGKDCGICDYRRICGDLIALGAFSRRKITAANPALASFRQLRAASLPQEEA